MDTVLTGEQNAGDAFRFPTPVARGWLLPPSTTDDWLAIAVPSRSRAACCSCFPASPD